MPAAPLSIYFQRSNCIITLSSYNASSKDLEGRMKEEEESVYEISKILDIAVET